MIVHRWRRAQGYIKGLGRQDEVIPNPRPDEHTVEKGRVTVPTKAVALDSVKDYGQYVYPSDAVKVGEPILIDHGILLYHYGVYMHPTDYMWHRYAPARAHDMVMIWIDQRIEQMAAEAIARLEAMYT